MTMADDAMMEELCAQAAGPIWRTDAGEYIAVHHMDTGHLVSTIKMLLRGAAAEKSKVTTFYVDGPKPSGDMSRDAFNQEFTMVLDSEVIDYVPQIFEIMWTEYMERRVGNEDLFDLCYGALEDYVAKMERASWYLEMKTLFPDAVKQ